MADLTTKQCRFAELYCGNGIKAAREAGYQGNTNVLNQISIRNLSNPLIQSIIQNREHEYMSDKIASREERQRFWTKVMMDSTQAMVNRLSASKLLGKSEGDFIDRTEIQANVAGNAIVKIPDCTAAMWEEMFEKNLNKEG